MDSESGEKQLSADMQRFTVVKCLLTQRKSADFVSKLALEWADSRWSCERYINVLCLVLKV